MASVIACRTLFWPLVWAVNLVGLADLLMVTVRAVRVDLPSVGRATRGRLCDPHFLCYQRFF
jgi:hypothetical protein